MGISRQQKSSHHHWPKPWREGYGQSTGPSGSCGP